MEQPPEGYGALNVANMGQERLSQAAAAYAMLQPFAVRPQMHVLLMPVDRMCRPIEILVVHIGTEDDYPWQVGLFTKLAASYAHHGLVVAITHPGGIAMPSAIDIDNSRKLNRFLVECDIALLDVLIVSDEAYASLRAENLL